MTRRGLLQGLLAGGFWSALKERLSAAPPTSTKEVEALQKNWKALLADGVTVPLPTEQLKLSKEEWRKRLDANQFQVLREEGGTGWPSFFTAIAGAFETRTDFKLILPRTEYHCARCGGHHGHIFSDGPRPTGKRWCNNGVALKFIPKSGKT
jgi:peptide-methionine (R)-S-oxide reductase